MSEHLSNLVLDELAAEVASPRSADARAHLDGCAKCQTALATLQRERQEFLARFPTRGALEVAAPRRAAKRRRPVWWSWLVGGSLALSTAALLVFVRPADGPVRSDGARVKGDTLVELAVGRGPASMPYVGQALRAGDRLAFRYSTTKRWLVLLNVDERGEVTVVVPEVGTSSLAIEPGQQQRLEVGFELDDSLAPELLVAIFSDEALELDALASEVTDAVKGVALGEHMHQAVARLRQGVDVLSWSLVKERP